MHAKCSRDVRSTRAIYFSRCERDGECNLKISKIILNICKSPLYIGMHVGVCVCAEDRSEGDVKWNKEDFMCANRARGDVIWRMHVRCEMCCHDVKPSEEIHAS